MNVRFLPIGIQLHSRLTLKNPQVDLFSVSLDSQFSCYNQAEGGKKRRLVRQMPIWYVVPLSIENKKNGSSRQKLTGIWPFWYTWIRQSLTYRSMDRLKVLSVCRRAYQNLFRSDAHKLARRLLIIHKFLCYFQKKTKLIKLSPWNIISHHSPDKAGKFPGSRSRNDIVMKTFAFHAQHLMPDSCNCHICILNN